MENDHDFSLLRPFDLAAAKRGDPICDDGCVSKWIFIDGGKDVNGAIVLHCNNGKYYVKLPDFFRMAPLCWVEGKPVYRGDVLYRKDRNFEKVIADNFFDDGGRYIRFTNNGNATLSDGGASLTWTPPRVKHSGWVNIYPSIAYNGCWKKGEEIYDTEEDAKSGAGSETIATIRIEWEGPPQ